MDELDEKVLDITQRQKRAQIMRRYKAKIERSREIAQKRLAPEKNIKKRAYAQARQIVRKRYAGKRGAEYEKLGPSEKMAIDRAIEKKAGLIKKIALRLIPKVKSAEAKRLQTFTKGQQLQNHGAEEGHKPVNEQLNALFSEKFDGTSADQMPDENKTDAKAKGDKQAKVKKKAKTGDVIIYNKFGEEVSVSRPVFEGLMKKVEKSGIDIETLGEVYNRGRDAWQNDGKLTQEQFAFARVNSYINEGSAYYELDADLHGEELLEKRGLWDNIHAKRKRIKAGSGERMRKPGSKGAPTAQNFRDAQESVELDEGMIHSVHVRTYDSKGTKTLNSKEFKDHVKAHGGEVHYASDKGVAFKFKHAYQANDFHRRNMSHFRDLGSENDGEMHEEVQVNEGTMKPYVKPHNNERGEQVGWKSANKYGKTKYWQMFAKKSAEKHAGLSEDCGCDNPDSGADNAEIAPGTKKRRKEGTVVSRPDTKPSKMGKQKELKDKVLDEEGNTENDPAKREVGTDSVVKAFKKDTPGQDPVLNESFNIAYSAGVGVTLTAADLGMKIKSGFELHPSVVEELKKLDAEEESE